MNKELTQALQPILDQAVTDCKQLAGAKLGVLFQIGQHILSAAARCDQDPVRLTDLALKRIKR